MKWFRNLAAILLTGVLYLLAVQSSIRVKETSDIITILLKGQKMDAGQAADVQQRELEEKNPLEINCWAEAGEITAECRENGHSIRALLILTGEKSELIVPESHVLAWQENGCFVDRVTASELFGTEQAAGQILWCGGQAYTVCGTFESLRRTVLRRADKADGQILTTVSCRISEESSAADSAEAFLMRHGLSGTCIDFTYFGCLSQDILLLLPLCLAVRLLSGIKRSGRELSDSLASAEAHASYIRCIVMYVLPVLSAAAILWFMWKQFRVPRDMIPTVWSDFSFWENWWKTQRTNLVSICATAQGEAQLMMLYSFFRSVCCAIGASGTFAMISGWN